jgi:hypothetical protein
MPYYNISFFIQRSFDNFSYDVPFCNDVKSKFNEIKLKLNNFDNKPLQKKNSHSHSHSHSLVQRPPQKMDSSITEDKMHLNMIKQVLNRISYKNFDDEFNILINSISFLDNQVWIPLLFSFFFSNSFFIHIYFDLFRKLLLHFPFLLEHFKYHFLLFKQSFDCLCFVSPDDDYDAFCSFNSLNEKNKNISKFLSLSFSHSIVDFDEFFDIIRFILAKIHDWKSFSYKLNEINELVENLVILLSFVKLNHIPDDIINNIQIVRGYKVKEFCGISSRSIFKLSDLTI